MPLAFAALVLAVGHVIAFADGGLATTRSRIPTAFLVGTCATIMATSSALAFVPRADFPTYCASKAFLHSWLRSLRHQLRKIPIEVLERRWAEREGRYDAVFAALNPG